MTPNRLCPCDTPASCPFSAIHWLPDGCGTVTPIRACPSLAAVGAVRGLARPRILRSAPNPPVRAAGHVPDIDALRRRFLHPAVFVCLLHAAAAGTGRLVFPARRLCVARLLRTWARFGRFQRAITTHSAQCAGARQALYEPPARSPAAAREERRLLCAIPGPPRIGAPWSMGIGPAERRCARRSGGRECVARRRAKVTTRVNSSGGGTRSGRHLPCRRSVTDDRQTHRGTQALRKRLFVTNGACPAALRAMAMPKRAARGQSAGQSATPWHSPGSAEPELEDVARRRGSRGTGKDTRALANPGNNMPWSAATRCQQQHDAQLCVLLATSSVGTGRGH
ncbi:hypothetical protein ERJ75_001700800 [Trypanosoma vivax]|nr:hypothetical protein ERJ75_001700800 [Trypanosoma vivax]